MNRTRLLTTMAVLVAIGTLGSHILWFPAGVAKAYPVQHAVNVITAVILGPGPAVIVAFLIGLLRNMLGLGTILAFPGGMVGAFLAGYLYKKLGKKIWAVIGEVVGTGIFGSLLSAPIANIVMGSSVGILFYIPSFLVSSFFGAAIAYIIVLRVKSEQLLRVKPD